MKVLSRDLIVLASMFFVIGCDFCRDVTRDIDSSMFSMAGGTIFLSPVSLSMKEVHLESAPLIGRDVILEGDVAEVSEYYTYLVLSDDTARMLVVLTELDQIGALLKVKDPKKLKILGTVESGKKGFPFLMAKSIMLVEESPNS